MRSLKVLSLNMHKGFSSLRKRFILHELREAVRGVGADIVFLQEVQGEHAGHALRNPNWPDVPQYEFLADTLWGEYAYGRNAVYPEGHHGNAILSRFPIISQDNIDVSVKHHEGRGLLHCTLQLPFHDLRMHVICVHLGLLQAHRSAQVEQLCAFLEQGVPLHEPVIVGGDFNDWRLIGHGQLAACTRVHEVFELRTGRLPRTFPARLPLFRIDRIYFRNLDVIDSAVLSRRPWSKLSDHVGLAAEFVL
jgi:endonuclease/exonuclease/phosphatase family metal-dependent hydrolase